jgi:serine/threonine protein kinase/tetratricopeptide (TPR) repeat protein
MKSVTTRLQPGDGEPFGRYRLLECLGEGGMAVVYRAITEGPKGFAREVVVKRIRADLSRDASFTSMLLAEARLCALLNHPGIVQVHELGEVDGEYFLAMEMVEGFDLSTIILRARNINLPPPPGVACEIILQLAEALSYAHTLRGPDGLLLEVVHRDVSPSNIMITPQGAVKLLDFGVARAVMGASDERTRTGTLKGKIGYLSPEQADGQKVDHRADLFALGIVFHELLTLQRLFRGEDDLQTLRLIREAEIEPPSRRDLDPEMERVVMRLLARDPAQRHPSCEALVTELQPIVHRVSADHGSLKRWLDDLAPIPPRHMVEDRTQPLRRPQSKNETVAEPIRPRRRRSHRWLVIAALPLVALGFFGVRALRPRSAPAVRTVAIGAFKDLSGRAEAAWLSTALPEMLSTEIGGGRLRPVSGADADLVLDGSYLAVADQLRLDLRVSERGGKTLVSMSETGSEAQLFGLVARVGTSLRTRLGDRATVEDRKLPSNPEAARLYAEGLAQLRVLDAQSARDRLTRAVAMDPQNAAIHSALSAAEEALGYEARSRAEAKQAWELARSLPPAERFAIEGRYRLAMRDWAGAVTAYRSLFTLHPDSLEEGLLLAHAQIAAERSDEALQTVAALRKLSSDDPRIDLAEAEAAMLVPIPKRGLEMARAAMQKGKLRGAPLLSARAHLIEGRAEWALGHAKEALAALGIAERMQGAAGDSKGRSAVLVMLSELHYAQGNLADARRTIDDALMLSRKLGDKRGEASALTGVANLLGETPEGQAESLEIYQRVLALCKSIDDKSCAASQLNNIGSVYQAQRKLSQARRHYEQSAALLREQNVGEQLFIVLANLASVLLDLGDLEEARSATEDALARCRKTGVKGDTSWTLYYLGRIELLAGELDAAHQHLEEAYQLDLQQGKPTERAAAGAALAELLLERGKLGEAEATAREALKLAKQTPNAMNLGFGSQMQVSEVLARVLLTRGRTAEAAQVLAEARKVIPVNIDPDWKMLFQVTDAKLTAAQGRPRPALQALARDLAAAGDYLYHQFWIRLGMAEIAAAAKLPTADAKKLAKEARARGFELVAQRADRASR